jgi:hypothetical protein
MNAELAEPGRLPQLIGGHCNLYSALCKIAGFQILRSIIGRAGAEGCEQEFRRRHAGVLAANLCRLIANDRVRPRLNCELDAIEMGNLHFHDGLPHSLDESHSCGDSLQSYANIFCTRKAQQAKILLREDRTQARRHRRIARNLQRSAAVDGGAQVAQECNAGWAGVDMMAHLIAGAGLHFSIQIL